MDKFKCDKCGAAMKAIRGERYTCPNGCYRRRVYEFYELAEIEYKPDDEPDPSPIHHPDCQCNLCVYDGAYLPNFHASEY